MAAVLYEERLLSEQREVVLCSSDDGSSATVAGSSTFEVDRLREGDDNNSFIEVGRLKKIPSFFIIAIMLKYYSTTQTEFLIELFYDFSCCLDIVSYYSKKEG